MSLKGKTILVTRQIERCDEFVSEIENRGGTALVFPLICISDPPSWSACDEALGQLEKYDALLFTSSNAAEKFFDRCDAMDVPARVIEQIEIMVVGEKTAQEVERRGYRVNYTPEHFSAPALVSEIDANDVRDKRILFATGNLTSNEIESGLGKLGALVESIEVYVNAPGTHNQEDLCQRLQNHEIDVVTFASPSAARNCATLLPQDLKTCLHEHTRIAVIGPTTRDAALALGFPVDIIPEKSTVPALVEAIDSYLEKEK